MRIELIIVFALLLAQAQDFVDLDQVRREQVEDLKNTLAALEAAYPEVAAEVEHEQCAQTCHAALSDGEDARPEALAECIAQAQRGAVDIWDTSALVEHFRKRYPDEMAKQTDRFWRAQFGTGRQTFVLAKDSGIVPMDLQRL